MKKEKRISSRVDKFNMCEHEQRICTSALDVSYVIGRSYRICLTYVVNIHVMQCFKIILCSCLKYAQGFSCMHMCMLPRYASTVNSNFLFSPSNKNVNSDFVQMSAMQ